MLKKNLIKLMSKDLILQALSQLGFGIIGALLILVITHSKPPTIATVNITGLEDSFIRETSKQTLTDVEKQQKVTAFARSLNQTVIKLAKDKHLVLVISQAVLSDVPDLTQVVAEQIKRRISA
jgi:hypothetical protein